MDDLEEIKKEIDEIKSRNLKVEADKAWETSKLRVISIAILTYVVAAGVLFVVGVENYLSGALIPTVGYFLSTLSLPFIKRWWVKKYLNN
jgi:hypothetical protein